MGCRPWRPSNSVASCQCAAFISEKTNIMQETVLCYYNCTVVLFLQADVSSRRILCAFEQTTLNGCMVLRRRGSSRARRNPPLRSPRKQCHTRLTSALEKTQQALVRYYLVWSYKCTVCKRCRCESSKAMRTAVRALYLMYDTLGRKCHSWGLVVCEGRNNFSWRHREPGHNFPDRSN